MRTCEIKIKGDGARRWDHRDKIISRMMMRWRKRPFNPLYVCPRKDTSGFQIHDPEPVPASQSAWPPAGLLGPINQKQRGGAEAWRLMKLPPPPKESYLIGWRSGGGGVCMSNKRCWLEAGFQGVCFYLPLAALEDRGSTSSGLRAYVSVSRPG